VRIVFVGSVLSSYYALKAMLSYKENIVGVFGLNKIYSKRVSDYYPINEYAEKNDIPSFTFRNINDEDTVKKIKKLNPDLIFVIGLSQIVSKEILDIPKFGCIGFHPTPLPKMRGRAAIPWMILLGVRESMATLFYMDENVDSGDIIAQEKYYIEETDYAIDVYNKVCIVLEKLIKENLPLLLNGKVHRVPQNQAEATYLAKRVPSDGLIDWNNDANSILRLIRAVSKPYPGAYSFYEGRKVIIWHARSLDTKRYIGLPGQIVDIKRDNLYVMTGSGLLSVNDYEFTEIHPKIKIGHRFGVNFAEEIASLKKRVLLLELKLNERRVNK